MERGGFKVTAKGKIMILKINLGNPQGERLVDGPAKSSPTPGAGGLFS